MSARGRAYHAVVVYSRVGGGHLSAARALAAELEATGRCTARLVDAYVESGRFPVTRFPSIYARLARRHPRLWSLIYHVSERNLRTNGIVRPFLRRGLKQLVAKERPDVIVSTLPVVNGLLSEAALPVSARVEVVLTDWHAVHPFWVASGVDHYTAPTDSAYADLVRFGAPPDSVDVVGIPVRREFYQATHSQRDRERLTELGLDPGMITVLAMVGAEGSPRSMRNLAALARAADLDAQLIVICGRNNELRRAIERLPARLPVRTLGLVEDIAGWMRAADVLVTKAGGLTLAEAFCCCVPVVVHDVLAGQEAGNLEFVSRHGAVLYAPRPRALVRIVTELAEDPVKRTELAERGARLARPDAARTIAENVLGRLGLDPARAELARHAKAE